MVDVHVHGEGDFASAVRLALENTGHRIAPMREAQVLWLAEATPILNGRGRPDLIPEPGGVFLDLPHGALVVLSSPVPVGYTRSMAGEWRLRRHDLRVVCLPENARRGREYADFRDQPRVVIGRDGRTSIEPLDILLERFTERIVLTDYETAEMWKHALNSMLVLQATWANALAALSCQVGADYATVERTLRMDPRIGPCAYVADQPIEGSHLLRDVYSLVDLAHDHDLILPFADELLQVHRVGV